MSLKFDMGANQDKEVISGPLRLYAYTEWVAHRSGRQFGTEAQYTTTTRKTVRTIRVPRFFRGANGVGQKVNIRSAIFKGKHTESRVFPHNGD